MEEKVLAALETVRPYLQADGGDVEFINIDEDNVVHVRLTGGCAGCPFSKMTLQNGIARIVKEQVPEVVEVVAD